MKGFSKPSFLYLAFTAFFLSVNNIHASDIPGPYTDILQTVIDMKELQMYFHVDTLPDRSPLIVVKNQYTEKARLYKFGQNVLIKEKQSLLKSNQPYLEFITIKKNHLTASVDFVYPVEGIIGEVSLRKNNHHWQIISRLIKEQ